MWTPLCLALCLWQAPRAPVPPATWTPAERPAAFTSSMRFVGFSESDRAAAFELDIVSPVADGGEDRYTLVQLVEISTRRLLANYRWGHGLSRHGAPAPAPARLAALHPDWSGAQSAASWRRVRRLGRFSKKAFDFKSHLVRILPDEDSHFSVTVDDADKRLDAHWQAGAFGFVPVVRLFVGGLMPLGHFRLAEGRHAEHAEVKVFHSATGYRLAVVAVFTDRRHSLPALVGGAVFSTPEDNPVGSTNIGSLRVIEEQMRSVEKDFKEMHPHGKHNWDVYVGRFF